MATTCTISIASDIAPGFGGISEAMTLTQAGTITDIDSTTGFQRRKLSATAAVDLVTMASELIEPKDSVAAKIYIRNIGDGKGNIDKSVGVTIGVKSEPIGKLFGGDWMMMPLTCIDTDDVTATPATDDTVVLEFVMFYEEA
jgi:hypothetical protein|tara:strand:- start:121 stop:546 length:426 start_codon:yes stop_codon:yes gene_type:complete